MLDSHPLVGLGELHRRPLLHALYRKIIGDPRVFCRIDNIVVEFGNARLQPIADRFVFGSRVSTSEKRSMWRETGQWLVWDSPIYEQFFDFVRETNARRPCGKHQVRVLLGDPPIDWSRVQTADDYRRFADRAGSYVGVVEQQVLARKQRALLIIGSTHFMKAQPAEFTGGPTEAQMIERRHPRALVSILPVEAETARRIGLPPSPSVTTMAKSRIGSLNYSALAAPGVSMLAKIGGKNVWTPSNDLHWPAVKQVADALINVGDAGTELLPDPVIYRDPTYQAELRRRAGILKEVYGFDFLQELEEQLRAASRNRAGADGARKAG
jgi:hypothetical protein